MTSTTFNAIIRSAASNGELFLVTAITRSAAPNGEMLQVAVGTLDLIARRPKYGPAARLEFKEGDSVTCSCDNGIIHIVSRT